MRDLLEDQGGGLGLTDPVSGEVAVNLKVKKTKASQKKAKVKNAKKAKKK